MPDQTVKVAARPLEKEALATATLGLQPSGLDDVAAVEADNVGGIPVIVHGAGGMAKEVTGIADRLWNHEAVGAGRDLQWWKEFFSVARMTGYNGWVSLEMEDVVMPTDIGIRSSIEALQAPIGR